MKILFVDDSSTTRAVYGALLEKNGYEVLSAGSMAEALELARAERPPLAIVDYFMPDGNGNELTEALLAEPETRDILVVMHSQRDVVEESLAAGAIDLIYKDDPQDVFLLRVAAMSRYVEAQSRQREVERVQREKAFVESVLAAVPTALLVVRDQKIAATNQRYAELFGTDVAGRAVADALARWQCPEGLLDSIVRGECFFDRESVWRGGPDADNRRYVSISQTRISTANEDLLLAISDVTERKRTEEQLRHVQKMDAVGKLTGSVAHEFNNLLTAISGYARLVQRRPDDAERVRNHIEQIILAADQAASLTSQLLAFSRKQTLKPEVVRIGGIIDDLKGLLDPLVGVGISVRADIADEDACAEVDPHQLLQGLLNLAINARDAMPDGGEITIGSRVVELDRAFLARVPEASAGRHVTVFVSDTGTGIDNETLGKIFEPFFTTKDIGKGTGLGLSMTYGMVKQSDGVIDVDSVVGEGTTFTIYLPLVEAHRSETRDLDPGAREYAGSGTILVAEDERSVRELTQATLEELGYHVLTAADGQEALEIIRRHHSAIDVLLCDVVMPVMSGPELVQRLAADGNNVKVIYMSAHASDAKGDIRRQTGDHHPFLRKPFPPDELGRLVREVMNTPPQRAARVGIEGDPKNLEFSTP
ncbi:MAG: response regulator [Alphaproteobacteria bacterium]